jgi:ABC-type multidrug transport system ATPase subunit
LDRDENGDATLFNFRLGDAKLSDGQKILLQFCMAIYSKETKISDLILMLDEPENHLHPEALVGPIDRLVGAVNNGQIWIATHSINLLAHFDPSNIWYIEEGKVSYAGNKPKTVLDGLLGREDEIHKLSNFLSLPALMATNQFAFECLFEPQSVSTGNDDPQTNQIIASINSLIDGNNIVIVLDFGAGKGRLLSTIRELNSENDTDTKTWLDYYPTN